jgi:hypothetical protein
VRAIVVIVVIEVLPFLESAVETTHIFDQDIFNHDTFEQTIELFVINAV